MMERVDVEMEYFFVIVSIIQRPAGWWSIDNLAAFNLIASPGN